MQGFFNEVALDVVSATGKTIPMLVNAKERRDGEGNLLFTRITLFVASERRRYERELVEAQTAAEAAGLQLATLNEELEKRVSEALVQRLAAERGLTETEVSLTEERAIAELREQFIAVLGHDLRNPVAAINVGTRRPPPTHRQPPNRRPAPRRCRPARAAGRPRPAPRTAPRPALRRSSRGGPRPRSSSAASTG